MKPLYKGIAIAVVHVLIVSSLGAKLLYDRARLPRVWVKTAPYDPNMPIRGRYVSLRLMAMSTPEAEAEASPKTKSNGITGSAFWGSGRARLEVRNNELFIVPDQSGTVRYGRQRPWDEKDPGPIVLSTPVNFFIPDTAQDPTPRRADEELWAEVTVPKNGPPRPIQVAKKVNNVWTPLNLR